MYTCAKDKSAMILFLFFPLIKGLLIIATVLMRRAKSLILFGSTSAPPKVDKVARSSHSIGNKPITRQKANKYEKIKTRNNILLPLLLGSRFRLPRHARQGGRE